MTGIFLEIYSIILNKQIPVLGRFTFYNIVVLQRKQIMLVLDLIYLRIFFLEFY